jgi:Prefoldin subunit
LYARATIAPEDTEEVYLWLGANVMLAYPIDEAETMLTEKLRAAEASLSNCEEDLEFLREQITVSNTYSSAPTLLTSLVLSVLFVSLKSLFEYETNNFTCRELD